MFNSTINIGDSLVNILTSFSNSKKLDILVLLHHLHVQD